MVNSKIFVLLSIAICLAQLYSIKASVEVLNKQNSITSGYLMLDSYSFKDGNIVYGICNGRKEESNCTVIQTKHPYANSSYTCNVTLKTEQKDAEIYSRIGLAALGQDKAIIFWHEEGPETYFKFGTIQLTNCEMKEVKIVGVPAVTFIDLFHSQKLLTYKDDSYDVIFQDPKRCGDKACRMTIDAQGKLINEPKPHMTTHGQFMAFTSTIATQSPANGLIYTIVESNKSTLSMIKADGTEKQIATYEGPYVIKTVAGNHDLISACFRPKRDSDINCTQYDKDGNVKLTSTQSGIDDKINTLVMHNLPKGGFLLILVEYEKCDETDCMNEKGYEVIKVNDSGKKVGSLRLQEFDSVAGRKEWAYIYENSDSKICAVLVGNELTNPHGISHIVVNCFTDDDFAK